MKPQFTHRFTSRQRINSLILFPFNLASAGIELIFCVPVLGRLLKWSWNTILTLLHLPADVMEIIFWRLEFRPEKKLKVGVVILSNENNLPLVDPGRVVRAVHESAAILTEQAKVKLLPAAHIPAALADNDLPNEHWITVLDFKASKRMLESGCDLKAIQSDLLIAGSNFQWINLLHFFFSGFRRFSGYGAPVTIFIVDKIHGKVGCSLGWISDYVTIEKNHLKAIPHELGHACNLLHRKDPDNLMYPKVGSGSILTSWQAASLRASRHVTIL